MLKLSSISGRKWWRLFARSAGIVTIAGMLTRQCQRLFARSVGTITTTGMLMRQWWRLFARSVGTVTTTGMLRRQWRRTFDQGFRSTTITGMSRNRWAALEIENNKIIHNERVVCVQAMQNTVHHHLGKNSSFVKIARLHYHPWNK